MNERSLVFWCLDFQVLGAMGLDTALVFLVLFKLLELSN